MKWGVRRFQNKDGSLTKAGKKRYSLDEVKNKVTNTVKNGIKKPKILQNHEDKLIEKYKERGYSQKAAETAAKQRIRTELFVGAVATVAVGVVATKVATRVGQEYFDKTIKSGDVIQNIGAYKDADFNNNPFYAAVNNHDKRAYGSMYPLEKRGMVDPSKYEGIYNNQIKITKDIKQASHESARKIFYEKMDKDPVFRNEALETLRKTAYGKLDNSISDYERTGAHSRKLYDRFNQALATPEFQSRGIHKKFYSAMKEKGYDAILDVNDIKYSGYNKLAKSPTIFFNGDKLSKIGANRIGESDIERNAVNYALGFYAKQTAKKVAAIGAGAGVYKMASDQQVIEQYLDEHPNSKLTKKEILERMRM